jgi:energy-coupling factor transporter ATP-binding protein EcfA2
MKKYDVLLQSPVSKSFMAQKAANSLDIDVEKKSIHHLTITADLETDFNVGLIIGASGSGKTTLAKKIFGDDVFVSVVKEDVPIIEQFHDGMSYDDRATVLNGAGLTSVPCWIRPFYTLSNGQKARAEIALLLTKENNEMFAVDEWTSVVDRTVAKAMSNCVQKMARNNNKKIVLLSCHYDVIEWLNPCWIIDCNKQTYTDRRSLWRDFKRSEQLVFQIRNVDRRTWSMFSKYHYLSDSLPGGHIETFGLFLNDEQIGFQCFANYMPWVDKKTKKIMHFNRTVVHPDYVGLGLGVKLVNETSKIMTANNYEVRAKFSSIPMYKALCRHSDKWRLIAVERNITCKKKGNMARDSGFRVKVKTYSFKYVGE